MQIRTGLIESYMAIITNSKDLEVDATGIIDFLFVFFTIGLDLFFRYFTIGNINV